MLYQKDDDGYLRIISLASRVLSRAETRYTTTEKELLAIVYSVMKFRSYLFGASFDIVTDHQALKFLHATPFQNARLTRWILYLQGYSYNINHCRGVDNVIPDFFSRNFNDRAIDDATERYFVRNIINSIEECDQLEPTFTNKLVALIGSKVEITHALKDLKAMQERDEMIIKLKSSAIANFEFCVEGGIVYCRSKIDKQWRIALPKGLIFAVLSTAHERWGHAGSHKLHQYLQKYFYWRGMKRDVKNYTRSCDICQRVKYLNFKMEGAYEFLKTTQPNEFVSIDFFGPLPPSRGGVQYIFVVQDLFSKLVTLYPVKRATTRICIMKIRDNYCNEVGKPKKILSDHGSQFTSPVWRNSLANIGIKVLYSSIRHPQSNPVERIMRELGRYFRTYCWDKHTGWAVLVPFVQDCLNLLTHRSTGMTPYELHYNRLPREKLLDMFPLLKSLPADRAAQIALANERLHRSFERRCKAQKSRSKVELKVGDLVLLRVPHLSDAVQKQIAKFFRLYEGPYQIQSRIGNNAFKLVSVDDPAVVKGTYNRLLLRKYYSRPEDS